MFVRANFVDIYSQGMRDRSMRRGTKLAREIKLTDWSMAGNLSDRCSGIQIPRDICTLISFPDLLWTKPKARSGKIRFTLRDHLSGM